MKNNLKELFSTSCFVSVLLNVSTDSDVVEKEMVYVQYSQDGLPKTVLAGIKPPDQVGDKRLLAAIEIVMKSIIKPYNSKKLDDDT